MVTIKTISSDRDLIEENLEYFHQTKILKQDWFYFEDGAELFYSIPASFKPHSFSLTPDDYYNLIKKNCLTESTNVALISLGCGNSSREKSIMELASKDNQELTLFAIDASMSMLDLSKETLKDVPENRQRLICADFSSREFREEILQMTKGHQAKIYAFLGSTLGNTDQDYMADTLSSTLNPGDYLWIDVQIRKGLSHQDDMTLFERYSKYLELERDSHFHHFFFPLKYMGVPFENGEMFLEMVKETALNAIKFVFSFRILHQTMVDIRHRQITLLENSVIQSLNIRVYDPDGLVNFFKARGFDLVDKQFKGTKGQFLFQKK